jgi:tetratricopeptide (TPR) repeat protein
VESGEGMKKIFYLFFILLGASLISNLYFFYKNNKLRLRNFRLEKLIKKMEEEIDFLKEEKENLFKENEKLKEEAVSFTNLTAKLQEEKKTLQKKVENFQKSMEENERKLNECQVELEKLKKTSGEILQNKEEQLIKENENLRKKISSLEATLKKERALYHYNLGVAYTKANLFKEAIESYQKCLEFDPKMAEAHYNLGLLYEDFKKDPEVAILHYQKYLELNPDAEDKEEVKKWIDRLTIKIISSNTNATK